MRPLILLGLAVCVTAHNLANLPAHLQARGDVLPVDGGSQALDYGGQDAWSVADESEALGEWQDLDGVSMMDALASEDSGQLRRRSKRGAKVTYYTGSSLDNPACYNGGYQPNDSQYIAAVPVHWRGKPKCRSFVQLQRGSHRVTVRIVDACGGCSPNTVRRLSSRSDSAQVPWFDLSEKAFKALGLTLSQGTASGVKWRSVSAPSHASSKLYGPN